MEIKIGFDTKKGMREVSFYLNFHRNSDLRKAMLQEFFNEENGEYNLAQLRARFIEFAKEEKMKESEINLFLEENLNRVANVENAFISYASVMSVDPLIVQFMANVFHNLVKRYFDSKPVSLGLYINAQQTDDFAFIVPLEETQDWVNTLVLWQGIELCAPYSYRRRVAHPLKSLKESFKSGEIISELVIRTEYFSYDYDEDDEEYEELTEFECLKSDVLCQTKSAYVTMREALGLEIYEKDLVDSFKK